MVNARAFKSFAIVFSTHDNLLVRISGALRLKETHFPSKMSFENMLWGISEIVNVRISCHCVQNPWKLTGRDFWSSRNDRNPLSQQKCVLRKCCRESHKQWKLELSKHCHFAHHSWKFTGIDFWSSRNKKKPPSKQKVFCRNALEYLKNGEN